MYFLCDQLLLFFLAVVWLFFQLLTLPPLGSCLVESLFVCIFVHYICTYIIYIIYVCIHVHTYMCKFLSDWSGYRSHNISRFMKNRKQCNCKMIIGTGIQDDYKGKKGREREREGEREEGR